MATKDGAHESLWRTSTITQSFYQLFDSKELLYNDYTLTHSEISEILLWLPRQLLQDVFIAKFKYIENSLPKQKGVWYIKVLIKQHHYKMADFVKTLASDIFK